MGSLSNLYISQSYTSLIHLGSDTTITTASVQLQDGLGNGTGIFVNSLGDVFLSGSLSASLTEGYAWVGDSNNRTKLVSTASFGGGSTTDLTSLNAFTSSQNTKNSTLASYTGSNDTKWNTLGGQTGSYVTSAITASSLITASFNSGTRNLTFTKGDTTQFSVNIPDVSGSTINTGSFATTGSNTFTGVNNFSQSVDILGGLNLYANGMTLGLPKNMGDPYENIGINTAFVAGQTTSGNELLLTGDPMLGRGVRITNGLSVTGSLRVTQNFTASLQQGYVWVGDASGRTTTVATSSFGGGGALPSGLLSSSVTNFTDYSASVDSRINAITASGGIPAGTVSSSAQIVELGFLQTSSFNSYTSSTNSSITQLNASSASQQISIDALNAATSSYITTPLTSLNAYTASNDTKWNTLGGQTGSYVTSAITASSLVTASFSGNTLTFTKGDASTFGVVIPDVSGSTGNFATTGSNVFVGNQTITGSLLISGSETIVGQLTASRLQVTANTSLGGTLSVINDTQMSGDLTIQSTSPQIKLRDTSGGGFSSGYDVRVDTGSFEIYDDTHNRDVLSDFFDSASASHTTSLTSEIIVISGSTSVTLIGNVSASIISASTINGLGDPLAFSTSVDSRLDGLQAATSSYATTGANTFNGNQTLDGSNKIAFSTTPLNVYINSPFNGVLSEGLDIINYSGGVTNILANNAISIQSVNNKVNITGKTGVDVYGNAFISGALNVTGSLTASLQEGYVWVGDSTGKTVTVATSSFGGGGGTIPAGTVSSSAQIVAYNIFATTGSNVFTGDQTLIDAGGNTVTLTDTSGSLMLVAKSFTSASAHLNGIANQVNLIFKSNNNTGDTVISGSNNVIGNPATPTAGFRRYYTNANISLQGGAPQISASMAFSPTISGNNILSNGNPLTLRGPVSSSAYTIQQNVIAGGTISLGTAAATNYERAINGTTLSTNIINGTLGVTAYKTAFISSSAMAIAGNNIGGATTLNADSSSITLGGNTIQNGGFVVNNSYYNASATGGGNSLQITNGNAIFGSSTVIFAEGSNTTVTTGRQFTSNILAGSFNSASLNLNGDNSNMFATAIIGHGLNVTGSSALQAGAPARTNSYGSAFFGRFNSQDGNKARTAETVFAIGTGTTTTPKTGFLIDSGSNTFVEGTLNVSGALNVSGGVYSTPFALTISSQTASLDSSLASTYTLTLVSGSTTHILVSGQRVGQTYNLLVTQPSVGTGSIQMGPNVYQPSGSLYVPTPTSNAEDILTFVTFNNTAKTYIANVTNFI
jgi:hypothetical protein